MQIENIFDNSKKLNKKKWCNKVKVFKDLVINDLENTINKFLDSDMFIIELQLFPLIKFNNTIYDVVIQYRIPLDQ